MNKTRYEEMLIPELLEARDRTPLAYLPIGSLEYHGFHLPLGHDTIQAHEFCLRAAEQTGGVVLPATYWGTRGHEGHEGSILLQESTVAALLGDILAELARLRFRLVVVFTGHHPDVQGVVLKRVGEDFMRNNPSLRVLVLDPFYLHPATTEVEHAGKQETSLMLHLRPALVAVQNLSLPGALDHISKDCVEACAAFGRQFFETVLSELVRVVREALASISA